MFHGLPAPDTVFLEKNDSKKLSCCQELDHKSDKFLIDSFDVLFQKEFGCYLPFFTNVKNQSLMCDLGSLSKRERARFYHAWTGTVHTTVFETKM